MRDPKKIQKQKDHWGKDLKWKKLRDMAHNTVRNISDDDRDLKNFDVDFDENEEDAWY